MPGSMTCCKNMMLQSELLQWDSRYRILLDLGPKIESKVESRCRLQILQTFAYMLIMLCIRAWADNDDNGSKEET